jgi:hypothetical protein
MSLILIRKGLIKMIFSAFQIPRFFLRHLGLWQSKGCSRNYRLYGFLLHLFFMDYFTFNLTVHLVEVAKLNSFQNFTETLGLLCTTYAVILKTIWCLTHINKIEEMFKNLKELTKLNKTNFCIEKRAKNVIKISKILYITGFLAVTFATVISIINYKDKKLSYDTWSFYDYKSNHVIFFASVCHQYIISLYGTILNYSIDLIPIIFMAATVGLIEDLANELSLIDEISANDAGKKLHECIKLHNEIKRFSHKISRNLSFTVFLQSSMSSIILCCSAFLLTTVSLK